MSHSLPHLNTSIISFRCTTDLKTHMESCAEQLHLTSSDLIRRACVHYIQSEAYQTMLPAGNKESTVAVISREEEPGKRDATIHHHIAFLNREEHDYQGFRFAISWHKKSFRRYFSPNEYGSSAAALAAAITIRDYVIAQLALRPNEPRAIYNEAKHLAPPPFPSSRRTRA